MYNFLFALKYSLWRSAPLLLLIVILLLVEALVLGCDSFGTLLLWFAGGRDVQQSWDLLELVAHYLSAFLGVIAFGVFVACVIEAIIGGQSA